MKTSTYFSLMAEFGSAQIPLSDLCIKYFNLSPAIAKRKAATQCLPVPVLKLQKSQKGQYFVKAEKLAEFIDEQAEQAQKEWDLVNN